MKNYIDENKEEIQIEPNLNVDQELQLEIISEVKNNNEIEEVIIRDIILKNEFSWQ